MIKRSLDVVVSVLMLLVLWPILLVGALAVLVTLGRPVLFRQDRAGLAGRAFQVVKLRTMREPVPGLIETDQDRLGRLGSMLRTTSVDELPQLFNVLRGDMSLVGPRPLLPEYLDRYSPRQARRHEVRPGLTGWAQVNGRNDTTWDERIERDVWYVENRSIALDLKILVLTVPTLVRRDGATTRSGSTMSEFEGTGS